MRAFAPAHAASTAAGTLGSYLALTKPRLLPLVLLSGLPALVLAAGGWPRAGTLLVVLGGTALAAGAANALNSYLERERDARMARTRTRPLPSGALAPGRALVFGLALTVIGPGVLWLYSGAPAAGIALAGILLYVFAYTLWLKPRSPVAVLAGGVVGAVAPLIADASVDGRVGAAGWILFAIVFTWQPPHFYAITLYRRREYEAAGFPLLVSRDGEERARRRTLAWIAGLVAVSLLPLPLSLLGPVYGAVALALGAWFLYEGVRLVRRRDADSARRVFRVSLAYLTATFAAMIADLALRVGGA